MKFADVALSSALMSMAPSSAVGSEAALIARAIQDELGEYLRLESNATGASMRELAALADACAEAGWDGRDAASVDQSTVAVAQQVLLSIPSGIPRPALGAEPDGQITMEWYSNPRRVLSVSVSSDGVLCFAATLGAATRFGREPFHGWMPRSILDLINEVVGL